jgi:hypothetical protein
MEIPSNILQRITQALNPGLQALPGVQAGQRTDATGSTGQGEAQAPKLAPLENAQLAVRTRDGSLLLSSQEKNILGVLFLNQSTVSTPSGFRLYGDQPQSAALRGSFVDLRG